MYFKATTILKAEDVIDFLTNSKEKNDNAHQKFNKIVFESIVFNKYINDIISKMEDRYENIKFYNILGDFFIEFASLNWRFWKKNNKNIDTIEFPLTFYFSYIKKVLMLILSQCFKKEENQKNHYTSTFKRLVKTSRYSKTKKRCSKAIDVYDSLVKDIDKIVDEFDGIV